MPGPLHLPHDQVLPPCSFHFLPSSFHLYSSDSTSFPIRLLFRWALKRRPFVARTGPLVSLAFMMYSLSSLLSILRKWCLFFLGNMPLLLPKLFLMLSNSLHSLCFVPIPNTTTTIQHFIHLHSNCPLILLVGPNLWVLDWPIDSHPIPPISSSIW